MRDFSGPIRFIRDIEMKPIQYPKYKDPGNKWFDKIPEDWSIKKLKHISNVRISNIDKKSRKNEPAVLLCNYIHVYKNNFITSKLKFMKATATKEQIIKFTLSKDDVLITKDSEEQDDIAVPAIVTEDLEDVLCGYHLALITPDSKIIIGKYLFRSFQSKRINDQFVIEANGVTRFGVSTNPILSSFFLIPPISDQISITVFLDVQTSRIDKLIEKNLHLIELLKEKRVTLINQTLTKGLDPKAKLNDSGIDWIGQIPETSRVIPFKRICFVNQGLQYPESKRLEIPADNSKLYITIKYIHAGSDGVKEYILNPSKNVICSKEDVLMARTGATGEVITDQEGVFHNNFFKINYDYSIFKDYLVYYLKMDSIKKLLLQKAGITTIPDLDHGAFLETPFIMYPKLQQIEIARYLDIQISKIENCIKKIQSRIDLLEEYKKSLINNVVTGKIDVREQGKYIA
jgi:type I restriction enzyme, S subunit